MKRQLFLCWVCLFLLASFLSDFSPAIGKPIELSFASFTSATSAAAQISEAWLKEIERRTNGGIKFNRYWGGTLLTGKNMYEGVTGGIAHLGVNVFGYTPGRFPLWEVMDLPVGFPNTKVSNRVQWEVFKKFNPNELAKSKVLILFNCSPCSIWSKVPIRKLEDMKGLEIRATGYTAKMVQALGGTPVGAPQPEVYEMLQKGIVKGTWSSLDVLKSFKQADVTKYVSLNGLYSSSFYMVMNLKAWNSLPADIQKTINDYSEEHIMTAANMWEERHKEGLQYAKDKGLEIITLPPDELVRWKKAVHPLLGDYVTKMKFQGLPGQEILDEVIRLREKYTKKD